MEVLSLTNIHKNCQVKREKIEKSKEFNVTPSDE